MGVINCTPDSFYDRSRSQQIEHSLEIVTKMINDGADWIDIGGESTRPGASEVSINEEIRRTVPLIMEIRKRYPNQAISIDTRRHQVAREAIIAGADMINDVSGLRDPEMCELVLSTQAHVCIMHMQETQLICKIHLSILMLFKRSVLIYWKARRTSRTRPSS